MHVLMQLSSRSVLDPPLEQRDQLRGFEREHGTSSVASGSEAALG
jgi:hypothetical protein